MIRSLFDGEKYTTEELNARLKFFIGIVLGLTLFGIVFVVLYSLIFVTQPMNGMSPVDNKFFELIIPIATFLTGTLSGIMLAGNDKDLQAKAIDAASGVNKPGTPPTTPVPPKPIAPTPVVPPSGMMNGGIQPAAVTPPVNAVPNIPVMPVIKKPGE
jgi:Na+-transporting methylmalonyl-CoA/oxaloacetate decarboxylase gamma subunit